MVKLSEKFSLNHLVVFDNESKIFAAGREQDQRRHLRLFLVNKATGEVYTRNGRAEAWEAVSDDSARGNISENIYSAYRSNNIPVYRIRGDFNA